MVGDKKVVYISGKITGTTDYMVRFAIAEKELRRQGYEVINPAKIFSSVSQTMPYEFFMDTSLVMLGYADAIYMSKGWEDSRGARIEFAAAVGLDLEVLFQ